VATSSCRFPISLCASPSSRPLRLFAFPGWPLESPLSLRPVDLETRTIRRRLQSDTSFRGRNLAPPPLLLSLDPRFPARFTLAVSVVIWVAAASGAGLSRERETFLASDSNGSRRSTARHKYMTSRPSSPQLLSLSLSLYSGISCCIVDCEARDRARHDSTDSYRARHVLLVPIYNEWVTETM